MRFRFQTVSVLVSHPTVLAQYDSDFERHRVALAAALKAAKIDTPSLFLQLGYDHEDTTLADQLAAAVKAFVADLPQANVTILCNTPLEVERFTERGVKAVFCHQNAFLDESRYLILPGRRRYDAVYLARLTPAKRHRLLETIASPRLLLIGAMELSCEHDYAEDIRRRLKGVPIVGRFRGLDISRYLCSATCGLMLSDREGANFATAEYALCGLPVVNTPSIGGRELLSPAAYRTDVPPEPQAIADAIARWVANPPDPYAIRRAFLALAAPHRETLRQLVFACCGRRIGKFPHKLGLRTPPSSPLRSFFSRCYLHAIVLVTRLQALLPHKEKPV